MIALRAYLSHSNSNFAKTPSGLAAQNGALPARAQGQKLARIGLRRLEAGQNRTQEADSEPFWAQGQKLARIGLRRLILSLSGLRVRSWPE